ncbi:MAG: transporter substrate-binding domain-containing protein [Desulfuromonadaceae bacterium]|nr:transporter substrate-binding domain-containing protein [Desulfuromonas sp.]MDY0185125.1 transporter substrate-binding domain-containing protein [Desulfuromonadaceae bacterium]
MKKSTYTHILILFITLQTFLSFALNSTNSALGNPINSEEALNKTTTITDFTKEEKEYLTQKKTIKVCIDPNWMPFEAISNNRHVGISADYLNLISQKLGIDFQFVPTETWIESLEKGKSRECDIFSLAMSTPERKTYLSFTTPYIVIPLVIATTKDKPFIADLPDVIHQRIGLVKGYAFTEILRAEYPEMELVEFDTLHDGLVALEKNKIYGFIDNLTTISYEITQSFSSSIKISGRVNRNWELGIAVRNDDPVLLGILDKAVRSIDSNAIKEIHSKWIAVTYEQQSNHSLLWKILAAFVAVMLLFISRYRKMNSFNRKLQELNMKLRESEDSFRYLVNNAYEGIAIIQNKRVAYANPRMCEMTGYDQN